MQPLTAECGGFLYLGQALEGVDGKVYPMAGVLPGQGFRVGRLVRFGYAALTPQADSMLFRAPQAAPDALEGGLSDHLEEVHDDGGHDRHGYEYPQHGEAFHWDERH